MNPCGAQPEPIFFITMELPKLLKELWTKSSQKPQIKLPHSGKKKKVFTYLHLFPLHTFFCLPRLMSEILKARQLRYIKWQCNSHNSFTKFWFIFQKTLLSAVCKTWSITCRQPIRSYGRKHGDFLCTLHRWELRISQTSTIEWNWVDGTGDSKLEL